MEVNERALPSVAVGRIIGPAQGHVVVGEDSGQHADAIRLGCAGRLDAREADLASVIETKAAAVDDLGDVTFTELRRRA